MDFSLFDVRGYPTVEVREGYAEWVHSYESTVQAYESTVQDEMALCLLQGIPSVAWRTIRCAADPACRTGRTGRWLKQQAVGQIDGLDLTLQMLTVA